MSETSAAYIFSVTLGLPCALAKGTRKEAVCVSWAALRDRRAMWVKPFEAKRAAVVVPIRGPAAITIINLLGDGDMMEGGVWAVGED